jgi:hypothetical protein
MIGKHFISIIHPDDVSQIETLVPEFLIFPIFSNICYQNVDFRVTNGDENRFIMA